MFRFRWVVLMLVLTAFGAAVFAEDAGWLTDFEQAKKLAEENQTPIFVNFTGSDWCPWCVRLRNEVFSKDTFKEYAKENLVLFEADFPRSKELPDDLVKQNEALARQYRIRGFPTILLLDADGQVLAQTGYPPGGAEAYVDHLQGLVEESQKTSTD